MTCDALYRVEVMRRNYMQWVSITYLNHATFFLTLQSCTILLVKCKVFHWVNNCTKHELKKLQKIIELETGSTVIKLKTGIVK